MASSAAPPTPRQMVRNHQGPISPSTIFMPGQLAPQNSVTAASRAKPASGKLGDAAPRPGEGASVNLWYLPVRVGHLEAGLDRGP